MSGFDLERFMAGEIAITRDGQEADALYLDEAVKNQKCLVARVNGNIIIYYKNGAYETFRYRGLDLVSMKSCKAEVVDKNVQAVIESYQKRAEFGFDKYGVNTERDDVDLIGWLQNLQEEMMDATIYIERLKRDLRNEKRL